MALANFTVPFSGIGAQLWATASPLQTNHATAVNDLLYGPAGYQETDTVPPATGRNRYHANNNSPYGPPKQQQQQNAPSHLQHQQLPSHKQFRRNNNYLPPQEQPPVPQQHVRQSPYKPPQQQQTSYQQPTESRRTYGESGYSRVPDTRVPLPPPPSQVQQPTQLQYTPSPPSYPYTQAVTPQPDYNDQQQQQQQVDEIEPPPNNSPPEGYPQQVPGYKLVQAGQGTRTQVHAVLDYDDENGDDYYDDKSNAAGGGNNSESPGDPSTPTVTPIQGPIFLKNGTVPVVPLFSYPTINNGSYVRIPIWWTALSVALGLNIGGDVISGVPCVKRYHQLFCPTAGNQYPSDKIERFIDDNKALMRRMYGDFEMTDGPPETSKRKRDTNSTRINYPGVPDVFGPPDPLNTDELKEGDSYFGKVRDRRQSSRRPNNNNNKPSTSAGAQPDTPTGRMDACESKVEIVTPYWASNSAGKIRAIVNTQHFEQAIHQEVCTKSQTSRCGGECGCEQKYKWHRLLAYDPDNDCKGIFMDWFLFPSCCVCRCSP